MAAEKIRIPGLGEVPRTYVYVAAAAVAGIVGYAWFTSGDDEESADEYPVDEGDLGYGDDSYVNPAPGGSTVDSEPVDPDSLPPTTNAEWTTRAVAYLESIGYTATTVLATLGKYLNKQPVTEKQADIIRAAIAAIGPPPQGEFFIIPSKTEPDEPDPPQEEKEDPGPDKVPRHRVIWRKKNETISNMVGRYNRKYGTRFTAPQIMAFNRRHRRDSAVERFRYYWFPINPRDISR